MIDSLPKVPPEELAEFNKQQPNIIEKSVEKILKVHNLDKFGDKAKDTMQSGMKFTVETLASIMSVSIPNMVDQQLSWGKDYLPTVGISTAMVLRNFEIIKEATKELMSENDNPEIFAWLEFIITKQREISE